MYSKTHIPESMSVHWGVGACRSTSRLWRRYLLLWKRDGWRLFFSSTISSKTQQEMCRYFLRPGVSASLLWWWCCLVYMLPPNLPNTHRGFPASQMQSSRVIPLYNAQLETPAQLHLSGDHCEVFTHFKGKPHILSLFLAQGPPLGSKLHWACLTKILDQRLEALRLCSYGV